MDKTELDMDNPLEGIMSAVIFVMQITVHATLNTVPMQLVLGRYVILNLLHKENWQLIKLQKQDLINKNTEIEIKNA